MQLVRHQPHSHPIGALRHPGARSRPAASHAVPRLTSAGTGIAVSDVKGRNGVVWQAPSVGFRDKGVRPQGPRLFLFFDAAHGAQHRMTRAGETS
jgi:hypothetical protein